HLLLLATVGNVHHTALKEVIPVEIAEQLARVWDVDVANPEIDPSVPQLHECANSFLVGSSGLFSTEPRQGACQPSIHRRTMKTRGLAATQRSWRFEDRAVGRKEHSDAFPFFRKGPS